MIGIDLFAGAGGTSTGAMMAGVNIVWAANHNPEAVKYHAINHPNSAHTCQGGVCNTCKNRTHLSETVLVINFYSE